MADVPTTRTFDLSVFIGAGSWIQQLTRFQSGSVTGSTPGTSREPVLGVQEEEASIHSVKQVFAFASLQDSAETDVLVAHAMDIPDPWCAVVHDKGVLSNFEIARGNMGALPKSRPAADARRLTLSIPHSGREHYGVGDMSVARFEFDSGNDSQGIGNLTPDHSLFLLIDQADVNAFAIEVGGVSVNYTSEGIHQLDALTANQNNARVETATVLSGQNKITGYVLVGQPQALPTG